MTKYLDPAGLTLTGDVDTYAAALGLQWDNIIDVESISARVKDLRPGDVIVTGPWGAPSWAWLPNWVTIEVEPDQTKVERQEPIIYALKQRGLPTSYAKKPPAEPKMPAKGPTPRYLALVEKYRLYQEAKEWADVHTLTIHIDVGDAPVPYTLVTDPTQAAEVIRSLHGRPFAYDYETTSKNPHEARILGLALADDKHAWYIARDGLRALPEFLSLLRDQTATPICSNYKYEATVNFYHFGVWPTEVPPAYDTQVMHWLLEAGGRFGYSNDLKSITKRRLGRTVLDYTDIVTPKVEAEAAAAGFVSGMEYLHSFDEGLDLVVRYAAAGDARNSYDNWVDLMENLAATEVPTFMGEPGTSTLLAVYEEFERGLTPVLAEMEINGLWIDQEELKRKYVEYVSELREVESNIRALGYTGNLNSGDQLADWLYSDLGLPIYKLTPSGKRGAVDMPALDRLMGQHPAIYLLKQRSELEKLRNTFLTPLLLSKTTHLHHTINQTSTSTGRLSSSGFNTMNPPTKLRTIFTANPDDPDELFFASDWSQVEPRIGAILSGDQAMAYPYFQPVELPDGSKNPAADPYIQLGLLIPGLDRDKILSKEKRMRTMIKALYLGCLMYGGGASKIQEKLREEGVDETLEFCRQLKSKGEQAIARYTQYLKEVPIIARQRGGYVYSMHGRRRISEDLFSKDPNRLSAAERESVNMGPQGTGADFLKRALIRLAPLMRQAGAKLRNPVHDEITGTVDRRYRDELMHTVAEIMEGCATLEDGTVYVPLRVEWGTAHSWYEAKP